MSDDTVDAMGYGFGPLRSGEPDSLCVMLHGFGADGSDMISAAVLLAQYFPGMFFAAPNAPQPCITDPQFFQWYDPTLGRDGADAGVSDIAPRVNRYVDAQLQRLRINASRLVMFGFSQGGAVAVEAALTRTEPCAALLCYTGAVRNKPRLTDLIRVKPPTLLVHGADDPVIPIDSLLRSVQALQDHGLTVQYHICDGIGHTMNEEGVHAGAEFLLRHLHGVERSID